MNRSLFGHGSEDSGWVIGQSSLNLQTDQQTGLRALDQSAQYSREIARTSDADFQRTHLNDAQFHQIDGLVSGTLHLKIEGLNLGGSIKLKTAIALIASIECIRDIGPHTNIIESSSGNLGVALSLICAQKGYCFVCVVDPNTSRHNIKLMEAYGATIHEVDQKDANGGYLGTRIDFIKRSLDSSGDYVWTNQYENEANVLVHNAYTAASIFENFSSISYLYVGAGTTGTLMGVQRYIDEHDLPTRLVAVDSEGSITFGGSPGKRHLPGLGASRVPPLFCDSPQLLKRSVPEIDSVRMCRFLAKKYGVLLGASSGTVLSAIYEDRDLFQNSDVVVAICPDMGERYLDTLYSDEWASRTFGISNW
ncbi:MAG: 2,3-diaminopropionate biosynthesis protein SbnA [Salinisphaera sp.]|jgi:2,3-diaminopropionate biosynthesis protein SbnA|nr:2,3-diaminopropionate biosynthesis protein SbnA [Salinisphaera sp.]